MGNVFEFLGLPANHRPKNKVVQLVKNFIEVPASKIKYPLMGQVKKDGVYGLLVVKEYDGKVQYSVFGRTGEQLSNCEVITTDATESYLSAGIFIGEICSRHHCSLEELSGVLNPNRVNELNGQQKLIAGGLYIACHDYLKIYEFIRGSSRSDYYYRYRELEHQLTGTQLHCDILPLVTIHDSEAKGKFTKACLAAGEEGAVYKQPNEGWVAGHKGYRQVKEVGEVSYDLLCTRVEEGKGKYKGLVANMYFRWVDGTEIKAMPGKGHTHESCMAMWLATQGFVFTSACNPIGKIWRVKGLMNSSKGKIRLPKVEEERYDKITADY